MTISKTYKCHFCGKPFKRKTWFDKHVCEKKQRFLDTGDIDTIHAHRVYNHWQRRMGLLRRGTPHDMERFQKSNMYKAFKRLVEFSRNQNLISAYKYIDWIIDNGIRERDWYDANNIEKFNNFLRNHEDPEAQAKATKSFIHRYCSEHNELSEDTFFEKVPVMKAIEMIRVNGISPWVLFGYDPAIDGLCSRIDGERYALLDELINIDRWADKIDGNPEGREIVARVMTENVTQ